MGLYHEYAYGDGNYALICSNGETQKCTVRSGLAILEGVKAFTRLK